MTNVRESPLVVEGFADTEKQESLETIKRRFLKLGVQIGSSGQMFFMAVVMMFISYDKRTGAIYELSHEYYPLFRGLFLIAFFGVCYGLILFVCKRHGVDYHTVLDVGPEHTYHYVIRFSTTLMTCVFLMFMLYVLSLTVDDHDVGFHLVSKHVWPAMAVLAVVVLLLWPTNMSEWRGRAQRYSLIREIFAVLMAPFSEPCFSRIFLGDVLTSMPKALADVQFTACIYATGQAFDDNWIQSVHRADFEIEEKCAASNPTFKAVHAFVACCPFFLRVCQCLRQYAKKPQRRHLVNSCKFSLSLVVALLSLTTWRGTWRALLLLSTCYSYLWDTVMDWALGPASIRRAIYGNVIGADSEDLLLRPQRAYPKQFYYFAMVTNTFARFGWALYISPGQVILKQHFVLILGCMEIFRRVQHAMLRFELAPLRQHQQGAGDKRPRRKVTD